jgi:hypothetical protein
MYRCFHMRAGMMDDAGVDAMVALELGRCAGLPRREVWRARQLCGR